jgi:hypothetical protein
VLKKVLRFANHSAVMLMVTAGAAIADCGGYSTGATDNALVGFLNFISGTPFRIGAGIALIACILELVFDGGQAPRLVKTIIIILLCVLVTLMVVSFIVGTGGCGNFTSAGG